MVIAVERRRRWAVCPSQRPRKLVPAKEPIRTGLVSITLPITAGREIGMFTDPHEEGGQGSVEGVGASAGGVCPYL